MTTISTSQIISVLSANHFLTQSEIVFLKASPEIVLFNFYGRIYYELNNMPPSKSKED